MAEDIKLKLLIKEGTDPWEIYSQKTFSSMAERFERAAQITSASVVLWDADTGGNMANFDLLVVQTDVEVELELTCNDGDGSEQIFVVTLSPTTPFILGADDSRYGMAAGSDGFDGTADVIDRIRAKEVNGTEATVELRAWRA